MILKPKNLKKKSKEKPAKNFYLFDKILDEIEITWYNMRIYLLISLFFLDDGVEMIVLSLIIKKLSKIWNLSNSQKGITRSAVFEGFFIWLLIDGKLSDTYGLKPVFVVGAVIVLIFSLASAFTSDVISSWFYAVLMDLV